MVKQTFITEEMPVVIGLFHSITLTESSFELSDDALAFALMQVFKLVALCLHFGGTRL